jgi:hypothetical protein
MAHFAQIDNNNIVQQVLVVSDNDAVSGQEFLYSLGLTGRWLQTSYNTISGMHFKSSTYTVLITSIPTEIYSTDIGGLTTVYEPYYSSYTTPFSADGTPGFRKNFAGKGYTYDESRDAFIPPKPNPTWILNESTCTWVAPSTAV